MFSEPLIFTVSLEMEFVWKLCYFVKLQKKKKKKDDDKVSATRFSASSKTSSDDYHHEMNELRSKFK